MSTKRDDIIKAAAMLFARKGVHGASVPQILQLANASAGAMYSYFESKRELADEVFRIAHQSFDEHVWQGFPTHLPPRAQLHEVCQRYALFISQNVHYAALVMLATDEVEQGKPRVQLHALIQGWLDGGDVHAPSAQGLFVLVHGALVELTRQSFNTHHPPPGELFAELEHYIWHAMTSSPT